MKTTIRITYLVRRVLSHLLVAPEREITGQQLIRDLGIGSGTIYTLLRRLEDQDWLIARPETRRDEPTRTPGAAKRRFYRLNKRKIGIITRILATEPEVPSRAHRAASAS